MSCPHGNPIGGCDICDEVDAAFEAGKRSALAEQPAQQEPKQSDIFCGVDFADGMLSVSVLRRRADDVAELLHAEQIELKAQRTWVGLTDEEIVSVVSLAGFAPDWAEAHIAIQIVRVLEAKLKEKNT